MFHNNIVKAKPRIDANYERQGHYYELINRVKEDTSRKLEDFAAIEKTIILVIDDAAGQGHRVGEAITHMLMYKHDAAVADLQAFISVVAGLSPESLTKEMVDMVFSDQQPFAGMVVEVLSRMITLKTGAPFTKITYKRTVPASELLATLPVETINAFFPNGALNEQAKAEAKA